MMDLILERLLLYFCCVDNGGYGDQLGGYSRGLVVLREENGYSER